MKELIVIIVAIALLSGIIHTIRYSSIIDYLGFFVVAGTYGLGFFGLTTMYESAKCRTRKKRWLMLFVGFTSIFVSYSSLEILYNSYGHS